MYIMNTTFEMTHTLDWELNDNKFEQYIPINTAGVKNLLPYQYTHTEQLLSRQQK